MSDDRMPAPSGGRRVYLGRLPPGQSQVFASLDSFVVGYSTPLSL
jgi:hypothetical protein